MAVISFIAVIIGVALAFGLFFFLPLWIVDMLKKVVEFNEVVQSILEGVIKIEKNKLYGRPGPVIYAETSALTDKPEKEVATFY